MVRRSRGVTGDDQSSQRPTNYEQEKQSLALDDAPITLQIAGWFLVSGVGLALLGLVTHIALLVEVGIAGVVLSFVTLELSLKRG
jgi:hypothetical protein